MSWNYRVVEIETYRGDTVVVQRGIHEVFYEGDRPTSFTADPVAPVVFSEDGDNPDLDLTDTIERMRGALAKPVLRADGDKLREL